MNAIVEKLAVGQLKHQKMNRERLHEIISLTVDGPDHNVSAGFDSYVIGAMGPLILTMLPARSPEDIEYIIHRISELCHAIAVTKLSEGA